MKYFTPVFMVIVSMVLLVTLLDSNRTSAQWKKLNDDIADAQRELAGQQDELRDLIAELRVSGMTHNATGTSNSRTTTPNDPKRNGKPKLDSNFLLAVDNSHFDRKKVGGTLKTFRASPKGFNPITENSGTANDLHGLINDALCSQHPKHPQLWSEGLATSCVISNDYKTYTFTLRKNVYWQIPSIASEPGFEWLQKKVALSAGDFVAHFETAMNPDVESPQIKSYLEDIESVIALDALTLQINWKEKVYTSLSSSMGMSPLPAHVYGCDREGVAYGKDVYGINFNAHWFDEMRQAIGVGAYILDEYIPDKIVSFKRNRAYWGKSTHFNRIEWDGEVRRPEAQWVAFQNGDVHTSGLPPTKYKSEILDGNEPRLAAYDATNPQAGRSGSLGWERIKSSSYSYIGWNMRKPYFTDKRVRQALTHAFPKKRIIKEVYYGLGRPQIANVHPDSVYYNDALVDYAFDLDQARALLDAAGWIDGDGDGIREKKVNGKVLKFSFILKYYANSVEWDSTLIIFKNELRKIGIEMKPMSYEWKEILRVYEEKDFQAVAGGWRFGLEVDFEQVWHSKGANEARSSNHVGFVHARGDVIAEKLRATFDSAERQRLAKEFQAIVYDEQPYTFFRSSEGIFLWQNSGAHAVHGVTEGFDIYHPLRGTSQLLWHIE